MGANRSNLHKESIRALHYYHGKMAVESFRK